MRLPRLALSQAERLAVRHEAAMSAELRQLTGREPRCAGYGPAPTSAVWLGEAAGKPYAVGETPTAALCAAVTRALAEAGRG
jgi:hypothetical protein